MSAQNISTGANIPNIPKKSKVEIVSNVRMSAQNIFARANILTVETDRMAVRRILWRAIFVRPWHHEHRKQNQREKHIIYLTSSSIHQKLAYRNRVNIGRSRLIAALKRFQTISYADMLLSEGTKYYFLSGVFGLYWHGYGIYV